MSNKKISLLESVRKIAGIKQLHESRMAEVDMIMQDVCSGVMDMDQVLTNPSTPEEKLAAKYLQDMIDRIAEERGLDPESDIEEIRNAVCDEINAKHQDTMESARPFIAPALSAANAAAEASRTPKAEHVKLDVKHVGGVSDYDAIKKHLKSKGVDAEIGTSDNYKTAYLHNLSHRPDEFKRKLGITESVKRTPSREVLEACRIAGLPLAEGIEDRQAETYERAINAINGIADPAVRDKQMLELERLNQVFSDGYESDDDDQMWGALGDMEELADRLQPKLSERWESDDYDDDEDRDVKIAMSDKRQQAFEKRAKKVVSKIDADKDMAKLAKKSSKDDEDEKPVEKKEEAKPAAKKAAPKAEEKPKAARGSFSSIAKPLLAKGASAADIRAALTKAGVEVKHLHSRLHALRKNLKEGYVLVHPHMPSYVLAENGMMNQYQWISEKDDTTSLAPMIFTTESAAKKVMQYVREYKNQACILTPLQFNEE